jgi:hypothetical protein
MTVENFDERFGMVAVEKGFITPEQLIEAIKIQIFEDLAGTEHRLIGQVLLDKGNITIIQIDDVLKLMGIL